MRYCSVGVFVFSPEFVSKRMGDDGTARIAGIEAYGQGRGKTGAGKLNHCTRCFVD